MTKIYPLKNNIIAVEGNFGDQKTAGGLIISDTEGKNSGIVPRWFKVLATGKNVDYVDEGDWILVEHGRWSNFFTIDDDRLSGSNSKAWLIDPNGILGTSDTKPTDSITYNGDTAWH